MKGFQTITIQHDDGCATLRTRRMADCRCKPIFKGKAVNSLDELMAGIAKDFTTHKEQKAKYN